MTALELIEGALTRTRDATLRASEGLTREELMWQPGPKANHIGFLLWHIGRVEDMWVNRFIRAQPEVWEAEGWAERCGGPVREIGYGFDAEQVKGVRWMTPSNSSFAAITVWPMVSPWRCSR